MVYSYIVVLLLKFIVDVIPEWTEVSVFAEIDLFVNIDLFVLHNWIFAGRIQGDCWLKNFSLQFQRRMNALVVLQHYINSSLSSVSMLLFITASVGYCLDSFSDLLIALFFRFLKDFINFFFISLCWNRRSPCKIIMTSACCLRRYNWILNILKITTI